MDEWPLLWSAPTLPLQRLSLRPLQNCPFSWCLGVLSWMGIRGSILLAEMIHFLNIVYSMARIAITTRMTVIHALIVAAAFWWPSAPLLSQSGGSVGSLNCTLSGYASGNVRAFTAGDWRIYIYLTLLYWKGWPFGSSLSSSPVVQIPCFHSFHLSGIWVWKEAVMCPNPLFSSLLTYGYLV